MFQDFPVLNFISRLPWLWQKIVDYSIDISSLLISVDFDSYCCAAGPFVTSLDIQGPLACSGSH